MSVNKNQEDGLPVSEGAARSAMITGVKSGSFGVVARASSQLGTLIVTLFSTRMLAIEEFGAFAIASALMVLSRNTFYVGSYEFLLKSQDSPSLTGSCLATNVLFALLSYACLVAFALVSPGMFETELVRTLILWLAPSVFLAMVTAWFEALMLRRSLVQPYYTVMLLSEAAGAATAIAMLVAGLGVYALLAQIYVRLLLMLILYSRWGVPSGWMHYSAAEVGHIIRWSWSRYGSVLLNFATSFGADLLLGILISPAASGLYRASNRIVSSIGDLFAQPLQKISLTAVAARTASGLEPGLGWLRLFGGIAPIAWGLLAGLACFADVFVPAILGAKWSAAVPIVMVFCAARALTILDATTSSLLVCLSQQRFMLAVQAITAMMAVAGTLALSPLGPFGVAFGTGLVMWSGSIAFCTRAARLSGIGLDHVAGVIGRAMIPGLGAILAVLLLREFQTGGGAHATIGIALAAQLAVGIFAGLALLYLQRGRIAQAFQTAGARAPAGR